MLENFERNDEYIEAPEYYNSVMSTARELASKEHAGLATYSGEEAVEKFQQLSETSKNVENTIFINAKGEITRNPQDAVATLVHEENNPSARLYFRERFNQPLDQ